VKLKIIKPKLTLLEIESAKIMTNYAYGVVEQARIFTGKVQEVTKIANLKWDRPKLSRGEEVNLKSEVKGIDEGTKAIIEIYQKCEEQPELAETLTSEVVDKMVRATWVFTYDESLPELPVEGEKDLNYKNPTYFFRVKVKDETADSEPIAFQDTITIVLRDQDGEAIANADCVVLLSDAQRKAAN
jgi:hypothetical protein